MQANINSDVFKTSAATLCWNINMHSEEIVRSMTWIENYLTGFRGVSGSTKLSSTVGGQ